MRAIVTDPTATPRVRLSDVPQPEPGPNQALIKVSAFSLNGGETRAALGATDRYVPGWDFAGVIEEAAADGSTSAKGTRVYGFAPGGTWAEYVLASASAFVEIPVGVSDAQAAAMPVAGVTALVSVESAGTLLGRRVLVTGAAGGVGRFACQLANLAGAEVLGVSRRPTLAGQLAQDGIAAPKVFTTIAEAKEAGRYDVILDGVGGTSLATALASLVQGGICVSYGNSSREPASVDPDAFYQTPDVRLQGVMIGSFLAVPATCRSLLSRLAGLVQRGRLRPPIDDVLPWSRVGEAAERLVKQGVDGKVVLEPRETH